MTFFKKEIVDDMGVVEATPTVEPVTSNGLVISQLEGAGLPAEVLDRVKVELNRSEDYTASVAVNRTVEDLPEVITALIDLIGEKEGEIKTLQDDRGRWLDVLGTKGNIPHGDVTYHKRANLNSIITHLTNNVYYIEYKTDDLGKPVLDENGNMIVESKRAVNIGIEKRNLDALNELAYEGNTRNLQGRIFGSYGGGTGIGITGGLDKIMDSTFAKRGKR